MSRSDDEIREHAQAELRCHPGIDDTDISVSVRAGVVSLSGNVHQFFDKYRAEDAVKRIAGVLAVANDIQVRAPGRRTASSGEPRPNRR